MNIILIGFMGSGKSSVAAALSRKLKCRCIETDTAILERSGRKSIKEIFLLDGEMRFREMEMEIAKKMSSESDAVISTGGGMVINKICIDYLKRNGKVIFLSTSFAEITRRLQGDDTRPLFADREAAQKLFAFRKRLYKQYADVITDTDNRSIDEIINIILKKI